MARRIVVACDVCGTDDMEADVETYPLTMPELGSFTLDLCASDRVALLVPLEKLAVESGVRVTGGSPTKPKPTAPLRADGHRLGRKPEGVRDLDCMACNAVYAAATGLRAHYSNVHGFPGGFSHGDVYGPTCPVCGAQRDWFKGHSSSAHGMNATKAVMWARDNGDPYGVVALIRERSRNVS